MWTLTVRISERQKSGNWKVVLDHRFYGDTQAEAQGIFESHMKTDAFLRGCVTSGKWTSVTCRAEAWWERS